MISVLAIGDTMQDIFLRMDPEDARVREVAGEELPQLCLTFADKIPVQEKTDLIGGNSANAAVAFARLGFKSSIYTHVGGDMQGKRIIEEFERNHVSSEYIVTDRDLVSNYNTVINIKGERTILIYHVHRHYALPHCKPVDWVYLSSMAEGFDVLIPELCEYLDDTKAKFCYQPGTFQLEFGSEKAAELLKRTHIFMVNREEAELYLGKPHGTPFRELLDGIRALGPKIALVTDGPAGAYASDGEQHLYLGIIEEAPRNEATGAGDSFSSAFAAALAQGIDLGEAMRWGQCEASSVIQYVGPQPGLLLEDQMEHLLKEYPDLQPIPLSDREAAGLA